MDNLGCRLMPQLHNDFLPRGAFRQHKQNLSFPLGLACDRIHFPMTNLNTPLDISRPGLYACA